MSSRIRSGGVRRTISSARRPRVAAAHYAVQRGSAGIPVGRTQGDHAAQPLGVAMRQRHRHEPAQAPAYQRDLASGALEFTLHQCRDAAFGFAARCQRGLQAGCAIAASVTSQPPGHGVVALGIEEAAQARGGGIRRHEPGQYDDTVAIAPGQPTQQGAQQGTATHFKEDAAHLGDTVANQRGTRRRGCVGY